MENQKFEVEIDGILKEATVLKVVNINGLAIDESLGNDLLNISNLYCIGRNGQHRYNNMDHSMMTGIMTVDCILSNSPKMDVWSVNTDKNYHEDNINKNKKM